MKSICALILLFLMSSIARAEQASFVPQPIPMPTTPITVDEYGKISLKEEMKRLKLAAQQIKDYKDRVDEMSVPIIFYGEKCSALKRANRAKTYLVKTGGIESDRIFTVYGGAGNGLSIRIYLLPVKPTDTGSNTDSNAEADCQAKRKIPKRPAERSPRGKI